MPIEWKLEDNNLLLFQVSGQLGIDEFRKIRAELGGITKKLGRIRVLVVLKDFLGWQATEAWGGTSATDDIDPYIIKFAIVGDEKWRDLVNAFTLKGLRPVPIEYFETSKEAAARAWLARE